MGAVVISMIIILLLYTVFDKVQSVFVVSQNRARVMEEGRIAIDMMVKDFQALSPAKINDLSGTVPNIDWLGNLNLEYEGVSLKKNVVLGMITWEEAMIIYREKLLSEVNPVAYLSPVRPFYIEAIDNDTGMLQVEGLVGPAIGDKISFPDSPNKYGTGFATKAFQRKFTYYRVPGNNISPYNPFLNFNGVAGMHGPPADAKRAEVIMTAIPPLRSHYYEAMSQELFWHHCRFFTNDEGWRFVDYKFGGRENYKRMNPASPVGALWVYRSRVVPLSGLLAEREDHEALKNSDATRVGQRVQVTHGPFAGQGGVVGGIKPNGVIVVTMDGGSVANLGQKFVIAILSEPVGYSRVMDGVISFRVRAVSPADPGRALSSPVGRSTLASPLPGSFYTGHLAPSHVEIELVVVDGKLVLEMEEEIEQRMEGEPDPAKKYHAKLKHLSENLDRVYFYKQLIRIKGEGQ